MFKCVLSLIFAVGCATATTITILDNTANEQVQILRDGVVVLTQTVQGTPLLLLDNAFPVHPPTAVFVTANFTEAFAPLGQNISDTLRIILTPNNDGTTAALSLAFTSDLEGGVAGITGPGTQLIAEAAGGNAVVTNNAGFVDGSGNVVKATDFGGTGTISVNVFSDPEIPEPSTMLLVFSGIIAASWITIWRRVRHCFKKR